MPHRLCHGPEPLGTAKGRVFDPETLEIRPWAAPIPVAPATCGDYQAVVDRKNNRLSLYAGGRGSGRLAVGPRAPRPRPQLLLGP